MKTILMSLLLVSTMSLLGNRAAAQQNKTMSAQDLVKTLSTVTTQNGLINVGGVNVDVSNVTVQDLVTVQRVLNNAEITALNNLLNNNQVSVDLSSLLRRANVLNKNQIIVGVLSDQDRIRFVTQNARSRR